MYDRTKALLARLPAGRVRGAEVGVFRGRMSAELLRARPHLFLLMVDNWKPEEGQPEPYRATGDHHAHLSASSQDANRRLAERDTTFAAKRRRIWHMESIEAAEKCPVRSLDFVFLDGDHSYEGVRTDIRAWLPALRPGGLLGGHDYDHVGIYDFKGVNEAVDEACEEFGWTLEKDEGSTWFVNR